MQESEHPMLLALEIFEFLTDDTGFPPLILQSEQ